MIMMNRKIERTWFGFITNNNKISNSNNNSRRRSKIMVSRPTSLPLSSSSSSSPTTIFAIFYPYIVFAIFFIILSYNINYVRADDKNSGIRLNEIISTTPMTSTINKTIIITTTELPLSLSSYDKLTSHQFNLNNDTKIGDKFKINTNNNSSKRNNNSNKWTTGNELWDNIIGDCYKIPTFSCFQKNVYSYLDKTLDVNDVNITNYLKFYKNKVDYTKYTRDANNPYHDYHHHQNHQSYDNNNYQFDDKEELDNEIPNETRSDSPIEEVTNALSDKTLKFAITHDYEIKLPEIFFSGAIIKISPKSFEGNGALIKLELMPKNEIEEKETGRIFFKKIKQAIKNKLLLSFLALLLIIKLIKIKLFWILPIIVGVSTAKKLILKFLLFLFPALSHIFKLCSYYHDSYHATKYHHHHHHVKHHHHTVLPQWYHDHDHHHTAVIPNGPELIFTDPPKIHPAEFLHGHHQHQPPISHYESDWEHSGPGLGSEYISDIHRNAHVEGPYFKPKLDDANEINSWGLGTTYTPSSPSHSYHINPFIQEPGGKSMKYNFRMVTPQKLKNHGPVYNPQRQSTPSMTAAQIAAQYGPQINQNSVNVKDIQRAQAQAKEALRIQAEQKLVAQQQKILQQQPFVQDSQPIYPKDYDPFFSPILSKIDKILMQLGFTDDYCKERLICSMYKNPTRYSPHSNFVSAELSRDTSELEKPSSTNTAAIRFYRYVQAARDGQEQSDCMRLYPHCSISTE